MMNLPKTLARKADKMAAGGQGGGIDGWIFTLVELHCSSVRVSGS